MNKDLTSKEVYIDTLLDNEFLEVYINGWYLASVKLEDLSKQALTQLGREDND